MFFYTGACSLACLTLNWCSARDYGACMCTCHYAISTLVIYVHKYVILHVLQFIHTPTFLVDSFATMLITRCSSISYGCGQILGLLSRRALSPRYLYPPRENKVQVVTQDRARLTRWIILLALSNHKPITVTFEAVYT